MAISKVVNPPDPGKRGGGGLWGKIGSVAGTALGGTAGFLVAGPAGAMAGAGLGGTVGGVVGGYAGEAADPSRAGGERPSTDPVSTRRLNIAMQMPEVKMAQMQRSKELLASSNVPKAVDYMTMIDQAQTKLKDQLGGGGSLT
jgi:hypothetical protein